DPAGWLRTSHLPTGPRADTVLGWCGALARGAADAQWPRQASALTAPLCWLAAGFVATVLLVRRLRLA
ncbi:MAG: hypothetical protein ACK5UQ_12765, partial [Planctomycetota bacterium]